MPQHTTESILRPAWTLSKKFIMDQYAVAVEQVAMTWKSVVAPDDPTREFIIRTLKPSDLGETNEVWNDTVTAVGNAFQNSMIASQNIADDTVIGIYGLVDLTEHQSVSYVRISVGAGIRGEWDLHPFLGTPSDNPIYRTGYAMTPIIATQNTNILIEQYPINASPQVVKSSYIVYLGITAEPAGKNIQPASP